MFGMRIDTHSREALLSETTAISPSTFFSPIINSIFPRGKCLSKGLSKHTLKTRPNTSPSQFINQSSCEFIIYLRDIKAQYLNNVACDEEGTIQKQQNDNHTKTTRGHMPTHRIIVILPLFVAVGLLLCR